MKKGIKFELREYISVLVESITSACLVANGTSVEEAVLISKSLGAVAKGFSLVDGNSSDIIFSSIENAIATTLSSNIYELTDSCKEILKSDILTPRKIIEVMSQSDFDKVIKNQIIIVCENDPNCDIRTFPVDELVTVFIEAYESVILSNHELATYASYCILRNKIASSGIHTANEQYVNSFTEPLFLHKDEKESPVNLKNLFILPKYKLLKYNELSDLSAEESNNNLQEILALFLQDNVFPFIFIEGDAGSGKTTLMAWMNYHYSLGDELSIQLFGDRPLITIRLRDLDKDVLSKSGNLSVAIQKYMKVSSLDELESSFPKAIMLLDGFDELCMIEGISVNHEMLLYDLYRTDLKGFHFIITTRPKFISVGVDIPSQYISLLHFDSEQREDWLKKYTSDKHCSQSIDDLVYNYIKDIDDDTASSICDTPMTLYMLAAKKGSSSYLTNNWALYHHIFYEELSETEYNKMFPNSERKYSHDIRILRDVLYRVSEEIAYQMYRKENCSFYLSDNELTQIIEGLTSQLPILKDANMKMIAQRCYALCCYWKANSNRGVVEFLHNNIRDFFLAEKIYREMDQITYKLMENKEVVFCYKEFITKLCSLFQYGILETKVTEFIFLRAKYKAEKGEFDFSQYEYQNKLIKGIIVHLSKNRIIESRVLEEQSSLNLVQRITNILTCTVQIYRHIYEPNLKTLEKIEWVAEKSVESSILLSLFRPVFCQVPVTITNDFMITLGSRGCFNGMEFRSTDLRNIGFQNSEIKNADFSNAILCGCDFSNARLDGTKFTNADIHYSSLQGASLDFCDMTGADLRGTELPDGFVSIEQDEQVEHLKEMEIVGLKI